jgi:hypothetical protein
MNQVTKRQLISVLGGAEQDKGACDGKAIWLGQVQTGAVHDGFLG